MQRRPFLRRTTAVVTWLAGCTENGSESPVGTVTREGNPAETPADTPTTPERGPPDCVDPERPEPDEGSGGVEPVSYPEKPPSLQNDERVADYIVAYENAYRTNALLERQGSDLERVQLGIGGPEFFDSPPNSTIARVSYTYGYQWGSAVADSPNTYVSYYVDDSVVARAEREGLLDDEDALEPDPLEGGTVLECFG